jgi:uncharacterized iron-regulated protein
MRDEAVVGSECTIRLAPALPDMDRAAPQERSMRAVMPRAAARRLCRCTLIAGLVLGAISQGRACVPLGQWLMPLPAGAVPVALTEVLQEARARRVVLLGEAHESAEHHRWQLHTLAALHAQRPALAVAFEMFPRSVQPVLDAWVAGELSESEFLERSRWSEVWGYEASHYLPLLHFARMHRIPMVALNVERELVRRVGREGFDAVPEAMREGVGRPEPATPDYLQELHAVYLRHGAKVAGLDDAAFARFVAGQQTWDRAMAEAIRTGLERYPGRQVVAIMGRGHTGPGAVPHQLRALGVADSVVFLPWDRTADCAPPRSGVAHAVFGVAAPEDSATQRPRLGVALSPLPQAGARIDHVAEGSVAAEAGLRTGDVLIAIAGRDIRRTQDVLRALARQAPGTWLPLKVRRDGAELDLIAKFPH